MHSLIFFLIILLIDSPSELEYKKIFIFKLHSINDVSDYNINQIHNLLNEPNK